MKYPKGFCVKTYDSHADITINEPEELKFNVKDVDHDGYNDLIFSGQMVLTKAVTKDNQWVGLIKVGDRLNEYSASNPFKKLPLSVEFIYNPKTETFSSARPYSEYCTENLYKLIYR